jgi:sialate O-acetylesterase
MKKIIFCILFFVGVLFSENYLKVRSLFGDHMVLQRNTKINIWGKGLPDKEVSVSIGNIKVSKKINSDGKWEVSIPPQKEGGPFEIEIKSGDEIIKFSDVYFGDVWVCSGQSNMVWPVKYSMNAEEEIKNANFPLIRFFQVPYRVSGVPEEEVNGKWFVCAPETVGNFSAVGYFFAREIHKETKIPIGMIQSAVGGTPAEAWISKDKLINNPDLKHIWERWEKIINDYPEEIKKYQEILKKWEEEAEKAKQENKPIPQKPRPPLGPESSNRASGLFNGMISPLVKFPITGVIWYQGESNVGRADEYKILFTELIKDWRNKWNIEFPFLFVQLANFLQRKDFPDESQWAELREAQKYALSLPKTAMACAIDIGEANNIHPKNKQDVGKRLALCALSMVYGKNVIYSGPVYESAKREKDGVRIFFKHTGEKLIFKGDKLNGFAVADEDKKFVWADAKIDGKTVILSHPEGKKIVYVRYGWADNPDCNLYNDVELPAVPFSIKIGD